MKSILVSIVAAVLVVGCATTQQPELLTAKAPDISIHEAAMQRNLEVVKQHIAAGVDVNAKDVNGYTPLDWAVFNKDTKTVDILRKHGGKTGEELKAEGE